MQKRKRPIPDRPGQKPRVSPKRGEATIRDIRTGTRVRNRVNPNKPKCVAIIRQERFLLNF